MNKILLILCCIFFQASAMDSSDSDTMLSNAAFWGNLEAVRQALEDGANVNQTNEEDETPLIWACLRGHTETAKLLIAAGADVNALSIRNETAINLASYYGRTDTVKLLLAFGADVNFPDHNRYPALWQAYCAGNTEITKMLMASGARGIGVEGPSREVGWLGNLLSALKTLSGFNSSRERIIKLMNNLQKFLDLPIERIEASAEYDNGSLLYKGYRTFVKGDDLVQKNSTHLVWAIAYHKNQAYDHIQKKYPHLLTDAKLIAKYFLQAARVGNEHVLRHLRHKLRDLRTKNFTPVLLKAVAYIHQLHPELTDLAQQILAEDIALKIGA